jgi:hypothetical protein
MAAISDQPAVCGAQASLGDFLIPQGGLFAVADATMRLGLAVSPARLRLHQEKEESLA